MNNVHRTVHFLERINEMSVYEQKNKKTKASIQQAFLSLLEKSSFEAIAVGQIATAAAINRGTFYLHYLDKYDLLDKIEEQLFEALGKQIDELQALQPYTSSFESEQRKLAAALFQSILVQAPLLKIFLSERGRAGFHLRFRNAFAQKVRTNLEKSAYFQQANVSLDYFLSFITSAFLGLVEQWVQNDWQETPEQMTTLYIDIIHFIQRTK